MTHIEIEQAEKSTEAMQSAETEKTINIKEKLDIRRMVNNITFLAKQKNIRMMDIEDAAGVSRGYLSRIANSGKSPAFDIVWTIAKVLGVDVPTLCETVLECCDADSIMMADFVRKLDAQTRSGDIVWVSHGGKDNTPDERYEEMELTVRSGDDVFYINHCQKTDNAFILCDDIAVYEGAAENKSLVIIPYKMVLEDCTGYDFIFVWLDGDSYKWEKVFYTSDDSSNQVDLATDALFNSIRKQKVNEKMTPEVRSFISNYLK